MFSPVKSTQGLSGTKRKETSSEAEARSGTVALTHDALSELDRYYDSSKGPYRPILDLIEFEPEILDPAERVAKLSVLPSFTTSTPGPEPEPEPEKPDDIGLWDTPLPGAGVTAPVRPQYSGLRIPYSDCTQAFANLIRAYDGAGGAPQTLRDEAGRFRVWTENTGAHRVDRASLDYRLQEASRVKKMVVRLLKDLTQSLGEAKATLLKEKDPPATISRPSSPLSPVGSDDETFDSGSDMSSINESDDIMLDISHIIDCLYELSVMIFRNPAPRDMLEKSAKIKVSHFERLDIEHVKEKFRPRPQYDTEEPFGATGIPESSKCFEAEEALCAQFGKLNTRRRQLLRYYLQHHRKISGKPRQTADSASQVVLALPSKEEIPEKYIEPIERNSGSTGDGAGAAIGQFLDYIDHQSDVRSKMTGTTATIFEESRVDFSDLVSESVISLTPSTFSEPNEENVIHEVPHPPIDKFENTPFICCFCYKIIQVKSFIKWRDHVFKDLRPYSCTFTGCPKANHLFDSSRDWYSHELTAHRIEWYCGSSTCRSAFASKQEFREHLLTHPDQPEPIIDQCQRPSKATQSCLFCGMDRSPAHFRSHVAQHMQQIALFAIGPQQGGVNIGSNIGSNSAKRDSSERGSTRLSIDTLNSDLVTSATKDKAARFWKSVTGVSLQTLEGHSSDVSAVAFSPDGRIIASGSGDNTIRFWNPTTGASLQEIEGHTAWVSDIVFSPDGRTIASGSYDKTVRLWGLATGALRQILESHSEYVNSIAFFPDGKIIALGSSDGAVRLCNLSSGQLLQTLKGHSHGVNAIALSPDGETIISGSDDRTVKLWDTATGALLKTLEGHSHSVRATTFSPDGKTIASASDDETVKLWDSITGSLVRELRGHNHYVNAVAFSADGSVISSGSHDKTVRLWDPATGRLMQTLEGHSYPVTTVALSPDGRTIASGSSDRTIGLWNSGVE